MSEIETRCPSCGNTTLFLSDSKALVCSWLNCKEPVPELYVKRLKGQLAECFRLTGADPDGNEDWRLAEDAVDEVKGLRADHDQLGEEIEALRDKLAKAEKRIEDFLNLPDAIPAEEVARKCLEHGELYYRTKHDAGADARLAEVIRRARMDGYNKGRAGVEEADAARRHAQDASSTLVKEKRALQAELEKEKRRADAYWESIREEMHENVEMFALLGIWKDVERGDECSSALMRKAIAALKQERDHLVVDSNKKVESETIDSVTDWADTTFGQATIRVQVERAKKEWGELLDALEAGNMGKVAIEAADVCICLYRVIGTLKPSAIDDKMKINRARKWVVDSNGTAQHIKEGAH